MTVNLGVSPALALTPPAVSSPDSVRVSPGPPEWGPAQGVPAVPPSVWDREQVSDWGWEWGSCVWVGGAF